MNEEKVQTQSRKQVLLIGSVVALIIFNIVLIVLNYQTQLAVADQEERYGNQKKEYDALVENTGRQLDSLNKELEMQIQEAKELGVNYGDLEEKKMQLEEDIKSFKDKDEKSGKQISYYQQKLQAYEELLIRKDEEIRKLTGDVENLYGKTVDQQGIITEQTVAISQIKGQKEKLEGKVAVAGALKVSSLAVNALSDRGKESSGGQYKSDQINSLKVYFSFADNPLAPIGQRTIYMRIIEPSGTILSAGTFKANGQMINYTAMKQILFDNSKKTELFAFEKGSAYNPGQHTVELYTGDGNIIGTGYFNAR